MTAPAGALIIPVGADPSDLAVGVRAAVQMVQGMARDIARIANRIDVMPAPRMLSEGEQAARALLQGLKGTFDARMVQLREDLHNNLINRAAFEREGGAAALAFNRGLTAGLGTLRGAGQLTDDLRASLVKELKDAGLEAGRGFADRFGEAAARVGDRLRGLGGSLTLGVTAPIVGVGALGVKLASDAAETADKMQAVFGAATGAMNRDIERLRLSIPATTAELQDMTAEVFQFANGMGASVPDAQRFARQVVTLAGDVASLRNIPLADVLRDFQSGFAGQLDVIRRYGVALDEQSLKHRAYSTGVAKAGQDLNQLGKTIVVFNALQESNRAAFGNAAQTATSASNSFKFLRRDATEAAQALGTQLLPVVVPLAQNMATLLRQVNALDPAILRLGIGAAAVGAALGPVLTGLGTFATITGTIATVRTLQLVQGMAGVTTAATTLGGVLAVGAPVALALAGTAALLWQINSAAREGRSLVEGYATSLRTMDAAQLTAARNALTADQEALIRERQRLNSSLIERGPVGGPGVTDPRVQRLAAIRGELEVLDGKVAAYDKQLAENTATTARARAESEALGAVLRSLGGATVTPKIDTNPTRTAIQKLREEVSALREITDAVGRDTALVPDLDRRIVDKYTELTRRLAQQKDLYSQTAVEIRGARTELEKLIAVRLGEPAGMSLTGSRPRIGPAPQSLVTPQQPIRLTGFDRAVTRVMGGLGDVDSGLLEVQERLNGTLPALDGFISGLRTGADNLVTLLGVVANPGSLVSSAGGLAGAAGTIGSTLGAAGAAVQVGAMVAEAFAKSAGQIAREAAVRENTDELRRVRAELSGFARSAANVASVGTAARGIASGSQGTGEIARAISRNSGTEAAIAFLNDHLRRFGVTFEQLQTVAEQNGIKLLDSRGLIVAEAFGQLAQRLGLTIEQMTRFGTSLDDQRDRESLRRDLFGGGGNPLATITTELGLLAQFAPDLAAQFQGLTASTRAGREAIRRGLQEIFTRIDLGQITPELLGKLGGLDDLETIIRAVVGAMGELDDTTRSLTGGMTNVPAWFKVAVARMDAAAPESPARPPGAGAGGGSTPSTGVGTGAPFGGGSPFGGGPMVLQVNGPVNITAAAGETTDQAAQRWAAAKKSEARAKFGDTTRWPELV